MNTSRFLDIVREVGDELQCHVAGISTSATTASLVAAVPPFKTARTRSSNTTYEGDELYLAVAEPSTTITAALTATSSSISVSDGSSWPSGGSTAFPVAIDSEYIMVTRSSNTLTVIARGWHGTRPAAHASGTTIYGSATAFNPETIAVYDPTTGTLTPGNSWAIDPGEVVPFDVFTRRVSINTIRKAVNTALRQMRYRAYFPLTVVADGDMGLGDTTHWTASASATVSKVTSSFAIRGARALRVLAGAAAQYAQSDTILVDPTWSRDWYVQAMVFANVGTARLIAYDVTNGANITTEDWALRGPGVIDFTFQLPATCEALAFRLEGVATNDDATWQYLMAYPQAAYEVALPSWVERKEWVFSVVADTTDLNRFDEERWRKYQYAHAIDDIANPNSQVRLRLNPPTGGPIWFEAQRPFDMLAGDAATTFADRDWLVQAASVEVCKAMMSGPASTEGQRWKQEYDRRLRELKLMNRDRMGTEYETVFSHAS